MTKKKFGTLKVGDRFRYNSTDADYSLEKTKPDQRKDVRAVILNAKDARGNRTSFRDDEIIEVMP
jgi:hypothetical protein